MAWPSLRWSGGFSFGMCQRPVFSRLAALEVFRRFTKLPRPNRGGDAKRPPRGGGSGAAKARLWQFTKHLNATAIEGLQCGLCCRSLRPAQRPFHRGKGIVAVIAAARHYVKMHDLPPWKARPEDSHTGRILALANCIFDLHYHTERHAIDGLVETFDNKCAGDLERAANVLVQSGFTRFIDDIGRRSIFLCFPDNFAQIAYGEQAQRIDVQEVCEAVVWLAEGHFRSSEEIDYLADLIKQR